MAKSLEFPQYQFVEPNSWTSGRKAGEPTVIFIHTTEGSEGRQSAEDGAAYDSRRTDGTSTHFFVDQDTTVQCVYTFNEAHATRTHGNDVGIQIEVCGRAGQTEAQWADAASAGAVDQAARVCVSLRKKYGKARFPLVNLTPVGLRNGMRGFAEHKDATLAWPEDGGTHTDPGPNFPWSRLFDRIEELETELTTNADADVIINRMAARLKGQAGITDDPFVAAMRAVAWQYNGGGLQGASSTLDALSDSQVIMDTQAELATAVRNIGAIDPTALVGPLKEAVLAELEASLVSALKKIRLAVESAA